MQICSTLPTHPHNLKQFRVRQASFSCRGALLNPSTTIPSAKPPTTTELTRKHLSKLEQLLQKQSQPDATMDPIPVETAGDHGSPGIKGKGLLEGLNLPRIWPGMKVAADEISPLHLNSLQQLLSKSPEYSPRNNLGSRWREYHGANDWAGLLDPLDENLRREVVRYGEFIQAAYRCFHSKPATSADEVPSPPHVTLLDRSYRVTRSLYATSSIGLPWWVDDVAPELGWMTQRSSWIGYVAVCDDEREIARMGRRDIMIALRGTATCLEWVENLRDVLVQIPGKKEEGQGQAKVECGFLSLYKTSGIQVSSLAESVVEEIKGLLEKYKGESVSITVTGHSLGAALALLVAEELSRCKTEEAAAVAVAVFSFGGPRVGNRGFGNRLKANNVKVLRIVNTQDVITKVPGMFVSEGVDKTLRKSTVGGAVLEVLDNNMPWAYSHVGTELRVDTKMSPFLKPNADVACCHDLEAYLHLVDGFLSSNSPFRANAKRSLFKLLHEQKPNVKKLYITKANHLIMNIESNGLISSTTTTSGCLPSPS